MAGEAAGRKEGVAVTEDEVQKLCDETYRKLKAGGINLNAPAVGPILIAIGMAASVSNGERDLALRTLIQQGAKTGLILSPADVARDPKKLAMMNAAIEHQPYRPGRAGLMSSWMFPWLKR
jgi:hypothetical protein